MRKRGKNLSDIDDSINWLEHPFDWWEKNDRPVLIAVPLQKQNAVDLMGALCDIHKDVQERNITQAIDAINVLGSVVIAKALNRVDDLLDVIAKSMSDVDMDDELKKLMEKELGNDKQ